MIKLRRIRWLKHVAHEPDKKCTYNIGQKTWLQQLRINLRVWNGLIWLWGQRFFLTWLQTFGFHEGQWLSEKLMDYLDLKKDCSTGLVNKCFKKTFLHNIYYLQGCWMDLHMRKKKVHHWNLLEGKVPYLEVVPNEICWGLQLKYNPLNSSAFISIYISHIILNKEFHKKQNIQLFTQILKLQKWNIDALRQYPYVNQDDLVQMLFRTRNLENQLQLCDYVQYNNQRKIVLWSINMDIQEK
jgi:hypothetical protein